MADYTEFSAKNTADALSQAQEHFALPLSRLEVEILSTGSGGLFGLFAKKAHIRVRPAHAASVKDEVAQILNNGRPTVKPVRAEQAKPARFAQRAMPAEAPEKPAPIAQPSASSVEAPEGIDINQLIAESEAVVGRLCQSLASGLTISSRYEDNLLTLSINCAEPGVLIGRRAQILDALQYLAARIVSHRFGRSIALMLDVEGYRLRQQKQLQETVLKLADKAISQGRAYTLGPLSTPERRLVHSLLKDKPVQTYSKGQGDLKRVVITPPGSKR